MGAHLAAINGVFLAHALLDKRMPRLALDGLTAVLFTNIDGIPCQPRVVDDFAPAPSSGRLQRASQRCNTLDESALFVKQETPIKVAIPGDPHVCGVGLHSIGGRRSIFRQQRVRYAVGKGAVWLVVHLYELQRKFKLSKRCSSASITWPAAPFPELTTNLRGLSAGALM